jgi:hypothetical protein
MDSKLDALLRRLPRFPSDAHGRVRQPITYDPCLCQSQPASMLLARLPAELRCQIWNYMDLSPQTAECEQWKGAYLSCRQMLHEIRGELKPQDELSVIWGHIEEAPSTPNLLQMCLLPGRSRFRLLDNITLRVPWMHVFRQDDCLKGAAEVLFPMYLRSLTLSFTGKDGNVSQDPCSHIKTMDCQIVETFAEDGKVNCRNITLSVEQLICAEDGRDKSFPLENILEKSKIHYTLTITQNKEGRQTERIYSFPTRTRPSMIASA